MFKNINQLNNSKLLKTDYKGVIKHNLWHNQNVNAYKVTLKNNKKQFTLDYYMGLGISHAPYASDVLYSLLMDSDAENMTLSDFCNEFGYDENLAESKKIYNLCLKNARGLHKLFTRDEIENLKTLLENY
jgi:hypothetical protein